jgi:hypothetical protein
MTALRVDPRAAASAATLAVVALGQPALLLTCYLSARAHGTGVLATIVATGAAALGWTAALAVAAVRGRPTGWWCRLVPSTVTSLLALVAVAVDALRYGDGLAMWIAAPLVALAPLAPAVLRSRPTDRPTVPVEPVHEPVTEPVAEPVAEPDAEPDAGLWSALERELAVVDGERGGIALLATVGDIDVLVAVVLPRQLLATSTRCAFSTLDVERVRDALDTLDPAWTATVRPSWLHTHPGLGVFLSGTDRDTTAAWRALDPSFRPIVVDLCGASLEDKIGFFDADGRALRPVGLVEESVDAARAEQLCAAVRRSWAEAGEPAPTVVVGAGRPAPLAVAGAPE